MTDLEVLTRLRDDWESHSNVERAQATLHTINADMYHKLAEQLRDKLDELKEKRPA